MDSKPEPVQLGNNVMVPVLANFTGQAIGWMSIRRDALPPNPNFTFGIGFRALEWANGAVTKYELVAVSPVFDDNFAAYLESRKES